ncbi:MAG: membrane-bound lytic murein transglycosylase MltF [Desulfobacterales bacterium]|nr:membrane-bound lytic murein transglycosylase MltF [Desulfobacterales bacterium]
MMPIVRKHFILIALISLSIPLIYGTVQIQHKGMVGGSGTYDRVIQTGTLRVITTDSVNTYHLYKGRPTGFEYDLALEFAKFLNVELDVVIPGWNNLFSYLDQGKGDMIAAGMAITKNRLEQVAFSIPYMSIQQRVIHHNLNFGPRNIDDLTFRTFHVRRGTSYEDRLAELKSSGIDFNYILHDNIPTENLIKMISDREIKFTIADSNIAMLSQRYYPDIRIGIPIQKKESLAWAVRQKDIKMLEAVNRFFLHANANGILKRISDKYYENIRDIDVYDLKTFHKRVRTRLPLYLDIIKEEAAVYGFDWRLVAAVIYQESHFNPNATSFTNVRGLMQVTSVTAKEMGIKNRRNPKQSVQAGIKYLDRMYQRFDHIEDEYQRMLFALASYNVGYGHVQDAIGIARKKEWETDDWQGLKRALPLLSRPNYYKKTKYGYARGWEPVQYVERILTFFDILKQKQDLGD